MRFAGRSMLACAAGLGSCGPLSVCGRAVVGSRMMRPLYVIVIVPWREEMRAGDGHGH